MFALGDGADTICDYDRSAATDTLVFGEGISASDLTLCKQGNDLLVGIAGTTDALTFQGWFTPKNTAWYRIERFEFADGTVLNAGEFENLGPLTVKGSEGNEVLGGSSTTATTDILEWFGVTYKEDADIVRTNLKELVDRGVYPDKLY